MLAPIFSQRKMITAEEFRDLIFDYVIGYLSAFPEEEVQQFLEADEQSGIIEREYASCVERFRVSNLAHPNEVFAAGVSRAGNLLALCFE